MSNSTEDDEKLVDVPASRRDAWISRAVSAGAVVWCGLVLLFHFAAGAFQCGLDTSNCAVSASKNGIYQGVLIDEEYRTWADTSFSVAFASRRSSRPVGGFATDAHGEYCIVWAHERITPRAHVEDGGPSIQVDAPWRPLNGADPPPGCDAGDEGIPWNRGDDLQNTPQFFSVPVVIVPAAALLLLALLIRRTPWTSLCRRGGLALTAVGTLLTAILWSL
jgi:hypothetical protein